MYTLRVLKVILYNIYGQRKGRLGMSFDNGCDKEKYILPSRLEYKMRRFKAVFFSSTNLQSIKKNNQKFF